MKATDTALLTSWPDERGYYGAYGGQFVPETLIPALRELESRYRSAMHDASFQRDCQDLLREYAGRPTPLVPHGRPVDELS